MKFTIFIKTGEVHFDHNGFDDYDGDTGYNIDIEVDRKRVKADVAEMIYKRYFCKTFSGVCPTASYYSTSRDKMIDAIKRLIDDLDDWDSVIEMYKDDLRDMYEEEYNRGE